MRGIPQSRPATVAYAAVVIRLVLVDDHPVVLDALARRLGEGPDDPGLAVVGAARDVATAVARIEATDPDVVVCDIQLDGVDGGLTLLDRLAGRERPAVLMLTAFDAPSLVRAAFERGAAGYLPKTTELDAVVAAIRTVAGGGTAYPARMLRALRSAPRRPSDRELEVIALLVAGASNGEIAGRLGLSEKTVESHLRRLFGRYGVLSRTELAVLAIREGWLGSSAGGSPA